MQYVRSISGSVSKTWNSINPATLSGAIDVIVIEQEDGTLACSPFHVRFGKFSLLRPSEKKVEFKVNDVKQNYSMKLGDGGEAFFVFETTEDIPEALQTSPLVSPAASPQSLPDGQQSTSTLPEPDYLDLEGKKGRSGSNGRLEACIPVLSGTHSDLGTITPLSRSPDESSILRGASEWPGGLPIPPAKLERSASEEVLSLATQPLYGPFNSSSFPDSQLQAPASIAAAEPSTTPERSNSPPPPASPNDAFNRAMALSKKLAGSNIPSKVTESGDLMLDMTGYKSSEEDSLRAEMIARKILGEELEGNYDIGALIGIDERGHLWIYSSEEAKDAAARKVALQNFTPGANLTSDAASDPGYHSDDASETRPDVLKHQRTQSEMPSGLVTPPQTPPDAATAGDPNRNYAKTLRLTSEQLKKMGLKYGANSMSFSVNKATCTASMYYWSQSVPIVISDIDGTITKSDALGHVLNMIGRDWTHVGVAKLYTDIAANGYHFLYLTSRSTGQADTTRAYLNGIAQDGYRLPKGPVIMSPDRTYAALRREIYLRKPEVFKMACLRDILSLFPGKLNPFYAGFGNRLTDALSYRSVNIPQRRIFTINSNAEISLDLLSLNKYRSSYISMNEVVDQFFPPVSMLVGEGGEEFTDFNYWRDVPEDLDTFQPSDSDDDDGLARKISLRSEDEGSLDDDEDDDDDDDDQGDMGDSYFSRDSIDDSNLGDSMLSRAESEDGPDSSIVENEEEDTGFFSNDDDITPLGNGGALKATPTAEGRSSGAKTPDIEREQPDLVEARTPKRRSWL